MFALSKFSVTQPVLVNLLTLLIVISGTVTFFLLPRELFPYVQADFIFVTTIYPRAAADEIEKTITVLIEEEISDVRGIKEISSVTVEGRSVVIVECESDNTRIDTDQILRDIESEIEEVIPDLPREAEQPVAKKLIFDFPVLTVSLAGAVDEFELKKVANDVKDELKKVRGVSDVTIVGEREEEIWVEIDPQELYAHGLSLEDVRQAIERGGLDLAAGLARSSRKEFIVRTKELYRSPEDLVPVVVKSDSEGGRVRIGDIAEVRNTFEERITIGRLDGNRTINLDVKQRPGGDTLDITRDVKAKLQELDSAIPHGITAKINRDMSFMVEERLDLLTRNGAWGLLFCLVILRFFLTGRMALITGLGIPFAFMGGLLAMRIFGISLNMISMFSLIIVLGMLVDDGIVVAENVHRYLERGIDPLTAAIRGSGEVFWSVVASVMTTVSAFAPLMMMSGVMGKFTRSIPMVVIFCLMASLIEALLVLPVHLAEWSRPFDWRGIRKGAPQRSGKPATLPFRLFAPIGVVMQTCGETFDRSVFSPNYWFKGFLRGYMRLLIFTLRHRFAAMAVTILMIGGVYAYGIVGIPFELFRNTDFTYFLINVELPSGARLEETERALGEIEKYLAQQPEGRIDAVISNVGKMENTETMFSSYGSNRGQIIVSLAPPSQRPDINAQEILDEVKADFPHVPEISKFEFHVDSGGPPKFAAVNFRIMGDNYRNQLDVAHEVEDFLETVEGVENIRNDFEWGKEELQIDVDPERASDLGLSVAAVAQEIRNAFAGGLATSFTRGKEEVEIHVKFPEKYRKSLQNIRVMKFRNDRGELVPFDSFAKVVYGQGLSVITRWGQKRTVTVSADVDRVHIQSNEANQILRDKYGFQSEKYPGITFDYAGENEDTEESMASLGRAFLLAAFVNYAIIATVFNSFMQPLVVMTAVPFALVGVIIGLAVHGEPMGFMALLGGVALVGIVVNDSIILLDFVNRMRRRGWSRWRSLIWSAKTRVRPILLTTLTTVAGLLPMLAGVTGTSTFLVPMAIALVYGLIFSTSLLLIVVPLLMSLLDGAKLAFGFNLVRKEYDESLLEKSMHIPSHEAG
jgi:multidrug efflux pump subunit AcrB